MALRWEVWSGGQPGGSFPEIARLAIEVAPAGWPNMLQQLTRMDPGFVKQPPQNMWFSDKNHKIALFSCYQWAPDMAFMKFTLPFLLKYVTTHNLFLS